MRWSKTLDNVTCYSSQWRFNSYGYQCTKTHSNIHKAEIIRDAKWNVQKPLMKGDFYTWFSLQERWMKQKIKMNRTSKQQHSYYVYLAKFILWLMIESLSSSQVHMKCSQKLTVH